MWPLQEQKKNLLFTSCRQRRLWGKYIESTPSRFLLEIPNHLVTFEEPDMEFAFTDESDPWQPGVMIYHDDYGTGVIQKRIKNSGNTVIHVVFESGRRAVLLPEFSLHKNRNTE